MRKPRPNTYNPAQVLHLIASDRSGTPLSCPSCSGSIERGHPLSPRATGGCSERIRDDARRRSGPCGDRYVHDPENPADLVGPYRALRRWSCIA